MRISIPRIDYVPSLPPSLQVSTDVAAERLALFLEEGKRKGKGTVILCGAGVSVDRCAIEYIVGKPKRLMNRLLPYVRFATLHHVHPSQRNTSVQREGWFIQRQQII